MSPIELWEACPECSTWLGLDANGKGRCPCGAYVTYARNQGHRSDYYDLWVACDACGVWREAQAQGGQRWECRDLFAGASCALPDDWQRAQGSSKRRRRAQREAQANAAAAQAAREARGQQRGERARHRQDGTPAAQRHPSPPSVLLTDPNSSPDGVAGDDASDYAPRDKKRPRPPPAATARAALSLGRDAWEECGGCRTWVNLGPPRAEGTAGELQAPRGAACPDCGGDVRWRAHADTQAWVQCDDCGRWRSGLGDDVLARIEEGGPESTWTCCQMREGATCRTSANDWGRAVRAQASRAVRAERGGGGGEEARLSARFVQPAGPAAQAALCCLLPLPPPLLLLLAQKSAPPPREAAAPRTPGAGPAAAAAPAGLASVAWAWHDLPASTSFCEYIPGRDRLYAPQHLAGGLDAFDAGSGEHVLRAEALPLRAFALAAPLILRLLCLFRAKKLPECAEGRASAGPVDLGAFLAQPAVREEVSQALCRRRARLRAAGAPLPRGPAPMAHVVHVSPDGRKVYIGDEGDATKHGTSIMNFSKSWRSLPIQSWSGGRKIADMPGSRASRLVASKLSALLAPQEGGLAAAAELLWAQFAARPATAPAAARMLRHLHSSPACAASALGRTGWNAYSVNVDYRTGPHVDGKNAPGSYSALAVFETGAAAFAGCFYLLPHYRVALDLRQGLVLFHRSGDAQVGLHANSGLHRPAQDTHRVALVLYQTELKGKGGGEGRAAAEGGKRRGGEGRGGEGRGGEGTDGRAGVV